jgi:hypothetical protein
MKHLIYIFLLSISTSIFAQYSIRGKIDGRNSPLESVTIVLLNEDSVSIRETISDKNGSFELNGVDAGNYFLSITHIGYEQLFVTITGLFKSVDLGNILLEEAVIQLGEVSVNASEIIHKTDRKILFPSRQQIASSANSVALLSYLPAPRLIVNLATNSVSLPGNETVELRINNVVAGNDEVRALPPNIIDRIEYIDNPGLRYRGVNAVLNYITKRQLTGGNIRMELNHSIVKLYGNDFFSAKINHKKSEFGFSYVNDFRDYYGYKRYNAEEFYFDDYTLKRIEDSWRNRYSNVNHNVVFNYNLTDKKTFLNVSLKYQGTNAPHEDFDSNITVSNDNDIDIVAMKDHSSYYVHLPSLDIYFEKMLTDKQKLAVNVVATDRYQDSKREYEEIKENSSYNFLSNLTSNAYSVISESIYENDLDDSRTKKLNIGLKHIQKWANNDYLTPVLFHSSMQQNETYLYSEYMGSIHRFNYAIGIGGKRSWYSQNEGNDKYVYFNFQPTLNLQYKINDKGSFRYRLNMYNDAPSLNQLTDADILIDSLQIRRGNPALKPGLSYQNMTVLDYTFNKLYLSFRTTHWYSTNFIQEKSFLEKNRVIRSYINAGNFQRLTFDIYARLSLFNNRFVLSPNIGMHRFQTWRSSYIFTVPYYFINAQFNYKNWLFYAMLYDQGAGFTGEIKYFHGNGNYIGAQYTRKNYTFGFTLSNMFIDAVTKTENISNVAPYIKKVFERDKIYALNLKFAMTFDFGRKQNSGQQKIVNSDSGSNVLNTGK